MPPLAASLAILAALVLALVAVDEPSPPAAPEPPPPHRPASAQELAQRLTEIRGLEFDDVPRVRMLSADEWRARVAKMTERQDSDREALRESEAVAAFLRLAGLAPPSFEIQDATEGVGELVGGFYRPKANRLYLVEQPFQGPRGIERLSAHELEHALQDQSYPDALKLGALEGEEEIALSALVEGDASVVERRYARRHLGLSTAAVDRSLLSPANVAVGLPPALVASVRFPYTAGADFVGKLRRRGGWEAVDEAFGDPPTTTEQILHPGKWLAREDGERVATPPSSVLGSAWRRDATVESGELDALVILAAGVPADIAARAAKGWDGGTFAVYGIPGSSCQGICRDSRAAVAVYDWETPADAAEFAVAAEDYLSERVGGERDGDGTFVVDEGAADVAGNGRTTAIAFAPDAALATRLATVPLGR